MQIAVALIFYITFMLDSPMNIKMCVLNTKLGIRNLDFVAVKQNNKIYIQMTDDISNKKTFEREVDSLLKIKDAYPKLLIARTRHEKYQYEGIYM
ncbi:hypothetical protein [Fusibacter sp. 3D3]|uniref:hypothetical protein n=1 Tax=Fusibacter sp. 3D3 TaxID=1048380 RepID=UPI000853D8BF|nr:hypothetical protein [Fusibacter sp. 3D3]GAU78434.1 ATPase [Fusibacter sp. 3D3]